MDGITYKDIETMTLMVGSASGLPEQFSDSDKVCAENAGIDYMDVIQFVGKDLDLNYVLSKEHTSEGYSDIIKIDKGDNNITFTSLYHESKESSDNLS